MCSAPGVCALQCGVLLATAASPFYFLGRIKGHIVVHSVTSLLALFALFVACAAWLCLFPFQLASLVWQCVLLGCNYAAAATFRCVFGDAQTETLLFLPPDCFYCPFYCLCCLVVSVAATSPSQLASFGEPDFVVYHVGAFPANKVGLPPPPPAAAAA